MPNFLTLSLFCALLCASGASLAVNKCEVGGKVIYTEAPCAGAKVIDVNDPVSGADSASARQRAAQEKADLKKIDAERARQTAQDAAKQKGTRKKSTAPSHRKLSCDKLLLRKKWAEEDAAKAAGKLIGKARRKAQRIAEEYALSCPGAAK